MLRGHSVSEMSTWQSGSTSITELLAALCDCSLSGVSWKRHSLGGISRVSVRRVLRRRAYGALLSRLFQDGSARPSSTANALANTPAHNKMLMISFDLRVSGCTEEAERLEKLLAQLHEMTHASGLAELDSVLELLVQLAGSVPPPASSFSRDYMRRVRPVLRRPPPGGYLSQETRRLESRAWALVCGEEWGVFRGAWRTLSLMDAPPGTGLPGLGRRQEGEERFDRDTRLSLFGALQHSRTADMDVRLDLPPLPSNAEVTGLSIRVPQCMDQSEDEGFQSASNLTPDSQSEPSPSPEVDVWEALRTFVPGRRRCWENVGCPPGQKESPYLTEAGREAFDQLYRLWEGELRNMLSSQTPSPLLPLPLDSQTQLVKDLLNVLIGVASTTFPLNEASVQFDVRPDVCVSGTSPESVSRLLGELAQYGTHYLRLSRFSLGAADKKGLVFQAFTGGLRRYLHYYRACVLSTPASLSLLTIGFHFRKLGRQLRYLSELCCVNGAVGVSQAIFPVGVKLLSYLYNEAQSNCSNENYPVLLSLLKSSCEPYTRFVSDWVYSGVFRDVYKEFMIQVNEDYLSYRDKHFWVQGYTLISQEAEDCVPVFLRHIANDVYICGKTINLLKICCPQHYIFCSELPVPQIAVIFSLQEMEQIERDCAVYRGRMETIAKHSAVSREEQVLRTELARQELINQVRVSAVKTLESIRGRQVSQRLAEEVRKRERFEALRQQLELDQEWRGAAKRREQEDDFSFARELRDREQRLQALEQQLERRARMDLIAQYSRLSEEAAKRERRAMWKVQRIRLDEARVGFLQQDQQAIQALLKKYPLRHGSPAQEPPLTTEPPHHLQECHTSETEMKNLPVEQETTTGSDSTLPSPVTRGADALISDEIDITDFFPKPPRAPDSRAVAQALHDIGSDLPEISGSPAPLDYDFSSPYSPLECLKLHPSSAHPSFSHIRIRENVSEVQEAMPAPSAHGPASWSSFPLSQYVPSVRPAVSQHGCLSQGSAQPGSTSVASGYGEPVAPPAATLTEEEPAGEMREPNTATLTMHDTGEKSCDTRQKELVGGAVESEWKSAPATVAQVGSANEQRDLRQMTAEQDPAELPLTIGHSQHSDVQRKDGHISGVLGVLPSSSGQGHTADGLIRIDELVSEVTTSVHSTGVHSHISGAHIKIGKLVLEVTTPTPSPNAQGHASDAPMKMGALLSDVNTPLPSPGIHDHASDAHIRIGELVSDVTTTVPSPNVHGHASDAHIRIGELVSDVTTTVPCPNVHGHASDAHIRIGELVSDVTTTVPSPNIHGHASDAHIRIGELVSDVTTTVPSPNVHGHASDAHIRIGELVSEVTTTVPSPNVHGHASDAHIRIGELVSDVTTTIPSPNVHGHASDAHIKVGEFVSDVAASRPRWSKHGHSSDSTLKVGCVMPDSGLNCSPLPGSTYGHSSDSSLGVGCVVVGSDQASHRVLASAYGHSSDSTLKAGCVVSGLELLPSPLPGSAYGHSSDSTLGVGCVVAGGEPTRPPPLPGSAHGHSSDSSLGMGCVVHGVIPGSSYGEAPQTVPDLPTEHRHEGTETLDSPTGPPTSLLGLNTGLAAWARGLGLSPRDSPEDDYLLRLASQYQAEHYEDSYMLMMAAPDVQLLQQVTRRPSMALPMDSLHCATDSTAVQLSEMMPLPVLMKHSVTTPLITHLSLVNKAVVDYYFVELAVEKHFEALRHFLLMEDGEFALSLTDRLFEKLGSGQTPGELLTPLVLNSILNKAMQYSLHGDSELAANFTFALRYLPEVFHPHAPDSLNCLELRYKVDWPLNVIITDSCMNKYNRLFSFLLQLKHMVWSLSDVWFHLKRTALVKGAGCSVQFRQLQLYRHEMQHFVKVIQGYIANQILQVSWSEFTQKLSTASDLDTIHHTHAEYLNRAIFRALLTEKAAPVMNIIHSIFSLILKFRGQLVAQPWESQQGETVHPCFIAMQQSYNTFKYYSHFLFKVVSKLVDKGYQPHLEDFLLRLNFNNYYKDS